MIGQLDYILVKTHNSLVETAEAEKAASDVTDQPDRCFIPFDLYFDIIAGKIGQKSRQKEKN